MFLSVSYNIKYQRVARKHMATSRDKEHSRVGSSAAVQTHTPPEASSSKAANAHSTATFSSTVGAAPVPKQSCHNKELSKHIHSVLL